LDILLARGDVEVAGFLDDRYEGPGQCVDGLPVLGNWAFAAKAAELGVSGFVAAIGDNRIRATKFEQLFAVGLEPLHAIHPMVVIAPTALIGPGLQAMAGVIINPGARVGQDVILNTACSIDHDCEIGEHAFIAPGARLAGLARVGDYAFVGIGASVIQAITIGEGSIVGAGAAVVEDIPPYSVAVGVPARVVRTIDPPGRDDIGTVPGTERLP
jgi:sugar O-acyltransferase (sialic acid O-acetyltransferase NeuD family)